MDVATSEFYGSDKTYDLNFKEEISSNQLKDLYKSSMSGYPIVSIEDLFDQDDWEHYAKLTGEIGAQAQIVGDDLLVTNQLKRQSRRRPTMLFFLRLTKLDQLLRELKL
ncbi:enolase 2-like [Olea europaea var. sylvestris]|uniref:enolase 2-like n=1 Tax=Olea europaea var. sylvestris TaxID=158386 RepID=UPI000C1CD275|nr:enolase 2-like [Olea europaea var. sylvestris]